MAFRKIYKWKHGDLLATNRDLTGFNRDLYITIINGIS